MSGSGGQSLVEVLAVSQVIAPASNLTFQTDQSGAQRMKGFVTYGWALTAATTGIAIEQTYAIDMPGADPPTYQTALNVDAVPSLPAPIASHGSAQTFSWAWNINIDILLRFINFTINNLDTVNEMVVTLYMEKN